MKYQLIFLVVFFECHGLSVSQFIQPMRTMDIYLKDFKSNNPLNKVQDRSANGCPNDHMKKLTPMLPKYEPSLSLPYPMIATTRKPLHISTPYIVGKPSKDVYPKKYVASEDDGEEDEDEYEDYEEDDDDDKQGSGNNTPEPGAKIKFDPDKYNLDYFKKTCGMCMRADRKIRRRSDEREKPFEELQTGNESEKSVESARDGFYKKYKKGSDTNGYSSKLHKDELFKDHIYYD